MCIRDSDIEAQTRAVFANVRTVLEASGARWEDLVDVTVYLTDMARDFAAYNAIWAEHFPAKVVKLTQRLPLSAQRGQHLSLIHI